MRENGHWYSIDGTPQHFVPKKDGTGNRPTTLADARKQGWLPSVTGILKSLDKPALRDWLIRQAVLAVCTAPDVPGEGLDAKITRILDTERQQDEESKQAMDRGTQIHEALEDLFLGKEVPPEIQPWVLPAFQAVSQMGKTVAVEKIVVGQGYAGKLDLMQEDTSVLRIWDFKSTKSLPKKGAWPEHILQASAYAMAVSREFGRPVFTGNVYISTINPGEYVMAEHDNWVATYNEGFRPLFEVWCWMNGYYPARGI